MVTAKIAACLTSKICQAQLYPVENTWLQGALNKISLNNGKGNGCSERSGLAFYKTWEILEIHSLFVFKFGKLQWVTAAITSL